MNTKIMKHVSSLVRDVAQKELRKVAHKNTIQKNDGSFVTNIDIAIDTKIRKALEEHYPEIAIISEETDGDDNTSHKLHWCIDPIDGTHNFMNDLPYHAVSVGLLKNNTPIAGIIYYFSSDELLVGGLDIPVTINNEALSIENNSFIVTTNRSHSQSDREKEAKVIQTIINNPSMKYRRFSSCALDIANLVLGRIGATVVVGNSKWDWSAGYAIAQKAGYHIYISAPGYFVITNDTLKKEVSMLL